MPNEMNIMPNSDAEREMKARQQAVAFQLIVLPASRPSFGEIAPVEMGVISHFSNTEAERYRVDFEVVEQAGESPHLRVKQVTSAQSQSNHFLERSMLRAVKYCGQAAGCLVDVPVSPAEHHADAAFVQTVECPFELPSEFHDTYISTLNGSVEQYE